MLIQSLINSSMYWCKAPYSMSPVGICVHNTYNDAPAKNEIAYMKSNTNKVSFHIAIDDIEAIQAIPFTRNAYHAGDGRDGAGNRKHIGIEICYSKSGGERFEKAEQRAAEEIALILKSYNWGIEKVKKHQDFSGKYCPHRTLDMGWQRFLNIVKRELEKLNATSEGDAPAPSKPVEDKPVDKPTTPQQPLGIVKGYNATVVNDWFYTRDSSGNKNGGRVDIGDKIKVLDVLYTKQLVYVEYPVPGGTKKAYISNVPSCIKYLYQDQWANGSTKETVYEKTDKKNDIGTLLTREKATPLYRENGLLHVVYDTDKGKNTKSGFVTYNGGFTKF